VSTRYAVRSLASSNAAPEAVVLAAAVDPDHGPHAVVVRHDRHLRRPDDVEDRQIGCAMQQLDAGARRLPDGAQQRGAIGHRPGDEFSQRGLRHRLGERCPARSDEVLDCERRLGSSGRHYSLL
jgi:hypothetical protein